MKTENGRGLYLPITKAGNIGVSPTAVNANAGRWPLASYPDVSFAKARERHGKTRIQLDDGVDPGLAKQAAKQAGEDSFEAVAREWFAKHSEQNAMPAKSFNG